MCFRASHRPDAGLFELVERGELELSFADLPLHAGHFESVELMDDPYMLVVSAELPGGGAAGRARRDRRPAADRPLDLSVLPRVEAELRAQGVEPNFVFRSDIIGTVQRATRSSRASRSTLRTVRSRLSSLGADVPVQPR